MSVTLEKAEGRQCHYVHTLKMLLWRKALFLSFTKERDRNGGFEL